MTSGSVVRLLRQAVRVNLRPYWREQIILILTVVGPVLLRTCLPLSLEILIDEAIPHHDLQLLGATLGTLMVLSVLSWLSEVAQAFVRALFGNELERDLRADVFRHIQQLPVSYFDTIQPGQLTALFATEVVVLRDALRGLIVNGFRAILQLVATLAAMLSLNWRLTLLLALLLPITLRLQRRALRRAEAADLDENLSDAKVAYAVQDNVASYTLVRAFGLGEQAVDRFERDVLGRSGPRRTLNTWDRPLLRTGFHLPPFLMTMVVNTANLQQTVLYMTALCVGAGLSFRGDMTVGTYSALLALILNFGQAVSALATFAQDTVGAATARDRIQELLDVQSPVREKQDTRPLELQSGSFRFQEVRFGYAGLTQFESLSFSLPEKGVVAFVGRSGCGKSTVMKLMLRFYDPVSGTVTLDGQDLREVRRDSLHGHLGVVLQDPILFNASVRDNIAVARPHASDEEVEAAARHAEVHEAIMAMPQCYRTLVGEGGKRLSPGQRQRVALARALLCQPALLILDEITSSLDPETEMAIHATLRKLSETRPVIMMTHRLLAVADQDHVVVLERGALVQQGEHKSLLELPGTYRQLWRAQSGFVVSRDGRQAAVTAERLQAIPLFEDMELESLQQLAGCFLSEHFEPEQVICSEGQTGNHFFIVVRGRVHVTASGHHDDAQLHVASLADGDYFGEETLIDATTYSTGAVAELPTLLLVLKRSDFQAMLGAARRVREAMEETALSRSLTLFGRRGRRPSRLSSTWEQILNIQDKSSPNI